MMLAMLISLTLASPIVSASGISLAALRAPTNATARKVAVRIDYRQLIEQESEVSVQDTVSYIRQDTTAALRDQHGVEVVEGAGGSAIVIVLSWNRHEESVYGVTIQTRRPGEDPRELETFECECIDSGLTEAVLRRLPAALAQLEEEAAEPGPGPEPAEAGAEPVVADPPGGEQEDRQRYPLGAMGKAGIGVLAGGVAGVVGGGIVFGQGRRLDNPSGGLIEPDGLDFRPPGIAVMVTGGVLAVTGVALLVVDRVRARRSGSNAARVRLLPGGLSMVLTAKF